MDTNTITKILLEELDAYTGRGLNDYAYLTTNEAEGIYIIIDVATICDKRIVGTILITRVVNNQVIIELDHHDKTLADALLARGVPESQIVLAYQGGLISA